MGHMLFYRLYSHSIRWGRKVKYKMKWLAVFAIAAMSAIALPQSACAKKPGIAAVSEDDDFLALRDAARNDDAEKADKLAARLGDYAIPSYVDYYRLRPRLVEASASEVHEFL